MKPVHRHNKYINFIAIAVRGKLVLVEGRFQNVCWKKLLVVAMTIEIVRTIQVHADSDSKASNARQFNVLEPRPLVRPWCVSFIQKVLAKHLDKFSLLICE